MFLATINKPKQLLHLSLIGDVTLEEVARGREDVAAIMADLSPGFHVLTDLGRLDSLSVDCAGEIGKVMEMCDQKGIGSVLRVIPDPRKDIGMNILAHFHYRHPPPTITCANMIEAAKALGL
jgi:anti-anti-sigma regulatory factor